MMNKNNNERKCKLCGKTIVGRNKISILCSACKKNVGNTTALGALPLIGVGTLKIVKAFKKKG